MFIYCCYYFVMLDKLITWHNLFAALLCRQSDYEVKCVNKWQMQEMGELPSIHFKSVLFLSWNQDYCSARKAEHRFLFLELIHSYKWLLFRPWIRKSRWRKAKKWTHKSFITIMSIVLCCFRKDGRKCRPNMANGSEKLLMCGKMQS